METVTVLQIIWFFLIGILFIGYSVLDGFDLGIGSAFPILTGSDENKQLQLIHSIGPVWDGNEVWLITAGGALFAAFPHAYATVFSGFYLALMIVLLGLILRAVSIEFFILDQANRRLWSKTFFIGSIIPSILFGVALGNVIQGVPLDSTMEFRGTFFTLLRPFPLACGLLGFSAILLQGLTFASVKTAGEVRENAQRYITKVIYACGILFIFTMILSFIFVENSYRNIGAWIAALFYAAFLTFTLRSFKKQNDMMTFIFSSMAFISMWGIAGFLQFPALVRSSIKNIHDITIFNASSSQLTLSVMLGIALLGMPLVIVYSIWVYKIFKNKIAI